MAVDELPPPSSGSFLELSFRRLLASCEEIMAGDNKGRADLVNWQRSAVFHHYVETLQEQLADLAGTGKTRINSNLLQQYRKHVDSIANQLQRVELPAYCLPAPQAGAPKGNGAPAVKPAVPKPLGSAAAPDRLPAAAAAAVMPSAQQPWASSAAEGSKDDDAASAMQRSALLGSTTPPGRAAAAAAVQAAAPSGRSEASTTRLRTHANIQEGLTDELVGLAASLKSNTLAMESRLRERGQLLEGTETDLDTSVQKTKASAAKAAQIHRRGRWNLCLTCLIMMVMGATFAGMYVFIRVTRFAGYKAARAGPAAPAPAMPVPAAPPLQDDSAAAALQQHGLIEADGPPQLAYERHYDL